ncbi:unnamed protein product [Lupinus luteus]|uniref:CCHC-type domain-containing protein n=1 Tax=Lupinus luteus TaxID=3873 RepID=A0AAV1WX00_LUPLU
MIHPVTNQDDTDDMGLFVKKFNKFLKKNKGAKSGQIRKFSKNNDASNSNQNFTCFECGKPGHMKMDCPNLKKSSFKGKNDTKTERRTYIAWKDNDTSSASEAENEERAHLSLMASHHSDYDDKLFLICFAGMPESHKQKCVIIMAVQSTEHVVI